MDDVHSVAVQLMQALQHMHCQGVMHRDVKPANILYFEGNRIQLADLGFAGPVPSPEDASNQIMGTPGYMSAELLLGLPYDCQARVLSRKSKMCPPQQELDREASRMSASKILPELICISSRSDAS